jgi:membrane protease YdiL (CAAX protease family)
MFNDEKTLNNSNQWGIGWVVFAYCGFIFIQVFPALVLSTFYFITNPSLILRSFLKEPQLPVPLIGISAIISQIMLILWVVFLVKFLHGLKFFSAIPFTGGKIKWHISMLAGLLVFVVNITIMALIPPSDADAPLAKLTSTTEGLLYFGFLALFLAPFGEELFFRGYIYSAIENNVGALPAIIISAVLFAFPHSFQLGDYWQGVLLIGMLGLVTGALRWLSGGLKASIICHFFYNLLLLIVEVAVRFTHHY